MQVGGHPDRGQRGAQLVRHVRGEPALQPGHVLQPQDVALQVLRHLVERGGQRGQVVLAGDLHPLVEQAVGEPLRGPGGDPDRADDHPGHEVRRPAPSISTSATPVTSDRVADQVGLGDHVVEREEVVELDLAPGLGQLAAEDQVELGAGRCRPGSRSTRCCDVLAVVRTALVRSAGRFGSGSVEPAGARVVGDAAPRSTSESPAAVRQDRVHHGERGQRGRVGADPR